MRWIQGLAKVLIEKLDLIVSNGYAVLYLGWSILTTMIEEVFGWPNDGWQREKETTSSKWREIRN